MTRRGAGRSTPTSRTCKSAPTRPSARRPRWPDTGWPRSATSTGSRAAGPGPAPRAAHRHRCPRHRRFHYPYTPASWPPRTSLPQPRAPARRARGMGSRRASPLRSGRAGDWAGRGGRALARAGGPSSACPPSSRARSSTPWAPATRCSPPSYTSTPAASRPAPPCSAPDLCRAQDRRSGGARGFRTKRRSRPLRASGPAARLGA